jgi:hypothetical protein
MLRKLALCALAVALATVLQSPRAAAGRAIVGFDDAS